MLATIEKVLSVKFPFIGDLGIGQSILKISSLPLVGKRLHKGFANVAGMRVACETQEVL